jgi:hypothetical protein
MANFKIQTIIAILRRLQINNGKETTVNSKKTSELHILKWKKNAKK